MTDGSEGFPENDGSLGPLNTDETAGSKGLDRFRPSLFCALGNSFFPNVQLQMYFIFTTNIDVCVCDDYVEMVLHSMYCMCKQM